MRRHTAKNRKQHKGFTDQIPTNTNLYRQWIDWFKTIPLWLDLGGIRSSTHAGTPRRLPK